MGDMGDYYRDWDAAKKERKAERLAEAKDRYSELAALAPIRLRTEWHWTITLQHQPDIEFWPSTGKWMHKGKKHHGNFDDFLGFVRNREAA